MSWLQAIVIGLLQGVTELFPVSSLGHAVLVPAWIGGSWAHLASAQAHGGKSPYLAFVVVLHVATALALIAFFWREWVAIVGGLIRSIVKRRIETTYERMAWLLVIATIPAGLAGLALQDTFRKVFAKPEAAAIFLFINGFILLGAEALRRRPGSLASTSQTRPATTSDKATEPAFDASLPSLAEDAEVVTAVRPLDAAIIGVAQIGALLAGISRSGITMTAGLFRGLDHEQAVRFAFLLSTPIILAAGLLKLPEIAGPLGDGIRGQTAVGAVLAFGGALATTKFLTKYFESKARKLTPFGIYCLVFGAASIIRFA